MENIISRMEELKRSREKKIKKLTKILNLLVNTEWDMVATATSTNDQMCKLASKSLANASSYVQTAISQLISTESKVESQKKEIKTSETIKALKKVVLNKK